MTTKVLNEARNLMAEELRQHLQANGVLMHLYDGAPDSSGSGANKIAYAGYAGLAPDFTEACAIDGDATTEAQFRNQTQRTFTSPGYTPGSGDGVARYLVAETTDGKVWFRYQLPTPVDMTVAGAYVTVAVEGFGYHQDA